MPTTRDPLTGLFSRSGLHELLERLVTAHTPFALILVDIDRFKLINYDFGDAHGDAVLQKIAETVGRRLHSRHQIGRWTGHQFLCFLPNWGATEARVLAEELRALIEDLPVFAGSHRIHVTASLGIACFPEDGDLLRGLIAALEAALYQAKESGRNRVVAASGLRQGLLGLGNLLDRALRDDRVIPAYQPIVELESGRVVAEEALARLITPEGDILEAEAFIEIAQKLQLTYKIDQAIITRTCARLLDARQRGAQITQFANISGNLLRHPAVVRDLLASMQDYCQACGDDTGRKPLVIEITERELLSDITVAREMLQPFVDFGLQLALDDFGSGYSSFQYLADLPFSFLKIEGSLIRRAKEPKVRAILRGMQNTARDLGLMTLAECVENTETADIMRELGIDWAQGYHYYYPSLSTQFLPKTDLRQAALLPARTGRRLIFDS